MSNVLRIGMFVRPASPMNIRGNGVYLAGWGRGVGRVVSVEPLEVELPASKCPPGWHRRGQQTVVVGIERRDMSKLVETP